MAYLLTSGGQALIRDWLAGGNPTPPSYIAIGTSTLPVGRFATVVGTETFRTSIVSADQDGASVVFHGFLNISDNAGNVMGNVGLFGGDSATGQANTGTLVAIGNVPVPFVKSAADTYNIDVTLLISGAVS